MDYEAVRSRIRRLPDYALNMADMFRKKDAMRFIAIWREGLELDRFPTAPLKPGTIKQKIRLGYTKPWTPLRGRGMDGTRTLASSLRMYKIKGGWRVRVQDVRHHTGKLGVAHLLEIHENGGTFFNGRKSHFLPGRPIYALAFRQLMREIAQEDPSPELQKICMEYAFGRGELGQAFTRKLEEMESKYGR